MNTTIRKIGPGDRTLVFLFSGIAKAARGAALPLLIAASAILPARGDGLSITPATLPDGMEGVPYRQTLFVEGGDQTYYEWYQHHASWTTAACSYQVSANETPLWEGRKNSGYVAYDLPFAFPFCGKTYDKVYAGTQGFLFFENASVDNLYIRTYYLSDYTGVAPFWWDTIDVEAYVDASVANEVSFRFESFSQYGTFAYRVTLKSDGTIRYAYRQDGNTFVATDKRVIGVGVDDGVYSDYVAVGGETDGIPETDIVFQTYGLPAGLQLRDYQDPDTLARGALLTGTLNEACDVKFAVCACTNYVGVATNFYSFSIVRNPNRPPVIDAFSPADTNAVIFLNLGDTANFNVAVTDEAGDPFDVKWEFLSRDYYYASRETVGTETNLVFAATQALYEMQNSDYQPLLRCTVSDECWTNTVTWKVNIRRDWHVNATADPGTADGSADHPWPIPHTGGLQRGDTVFVAPGTYVWGPSDSTQIGIAGGVTFRSTGSAADTKFVFQKKGYIQARYYKNSTFQGFSFDGICFYNCDLVDCEIRNYNSADSYDGAIRGCSLLRCYVTGGTGKFHCYQSDIVDSTIAGNTINVPSTEGSARAVGEDCTLTRSIVVNNLALDGVEANVYADTTYTPVAVTNSCTIPAMTKLGPGNYEAQPTFVSLAGGDLRLRVGSACIDADNPANNTGAYKGPGVEGFIVHAFTDPVRGIFSDGSELQIVAAGGTAVVMVKPLTDRAFLGWVTNGVEVAGATEMEFAIENIDCDYEVEALFEYREFWVNPTETDDSGDGTAAAPKKTIAAAAALAIDGETIRLAEGSYEPFAFEDSYWNGERYVSDTRALTFLGAGPDKTFIDGGGTNTCARMTSYMTLKNASLVNGAAKNYAGGVYGGTIENCVVSNCTSMSWYDCYAAGAYDTTIISSLIVKNANTNATYGTYAGGVYDCDVYNSTIANNVSTSRSGGAYDSYLKNCIVYGNTANASYPEYNEVRSCNGDGDIYDTNLIGSDPWFVDAANGDYRLTAGSPAIDAGEDVPALDFAHATDLAGERRIKNDIIDYGCYEGGIVTGAPVAPVATGTSAKAAKGLPFAWEAVPNAAQYRIYRGTSDNVASATLVGATTATNYLDTTTTGGTDYFYWISAYANSEFGESAKCGPIAVTSYADLKIETASLPAATEAVPYSVQLECSGNVGAATWSLPDTFVTREANSFNGNVGEELENPFPDSYYGGAVIDLPFAFKWFGETYTQVTISDDGGLYFGDNDGWLGWSRYYIDDDPKIAVLEGVSGMGDGAKFTGIRVDSQSDHITIVFTGNYGGYSSSPLECSATLYPDNTVRLAYGPDCTKGGYIAYSNGSEESAVEIYRTRDVSFAGMDDIIISYLPNNSGLAVSEDGLLTGIIDYAGSYTVSALVTDTDNGDVAYKTYTLTVNANVNARPVIDSTSPATGGSQSPATITKVVVPEGDSQTFAVAAHDPEGAALDYKWYLDDALVASGTNYTFTATELSRHTLACEVADALWTNGQVYAEWEIAVGKKFYVDAASTAAEPDGTQAAPFKTIMAALDEAISYEAATILVAPGTYGQSYLSGGWYSGGPTIVVRSTGSAADTFIDGNGRTPCVANYCYHDGLTFEGFTLRNGHADYDWTPSRGGGGSFMVNLKNCVVYNCTAEGAGGGVFGASIDHCTIYGCSAGTGGGIDATSTAINSIVWGNTATNAGATATANYETGAQFENCCTTPLPEGANIAEDPQFVNAAGGDFRLADTSPCLAPGMGCFTTGGGAPVGVTYTVTFNANGGTCAEATRTVAKGKAVGTLPQVTRPGYTLKGWYTAKTSGTKITASTTVTKDVTYYAQWTETPKYTVTFDANGGTCATKTRKVEQGAAIGELPEATRDGYTLAGWYTAKSGGTQVTASDTITKNITYYARWTEHYELVIEEGVLTGLTGTTPATIDVPATVTAFAANLFKGVTKITSATGGANVTKCGAGAFRDSGIWAAAPNGPVVVCGVLVGWKGTVPATVDVPNGVRVIADGAFAGATSLATVYLPDSLVSIGDGAFKGCTKLDDVIGLESGVTVAADAFEGTLHATFRLTYDSSGTTVIGFKGPMPDDLVIPAKVTAIAVDAFNGKATMTSVTLEGKNDVSIGANAFKNSTTLKTVSVGGSTTIGASAFLNCTALTNADFGAISSIGASAFEGCSSLAAIELPESLDRIGAAAFKGCVSFTAVHLPASLTVMGEYTFAGCTSLATITGGEGVRDIRTDAFAGTPWYEAPPAGEVYEEMVLGHVLVKIKGNGPAFYEISTNITMVASEAFSGQTTLRELYIGTEVFALWDRAFAGCASLGSVTVPSGCREFGDYLFDGCSSLTNVIFRGHAPTNDVPHVFAGTPESLTVHVKAGSRGWIAPESESTNCPAYWPVNGQPSRRMYCPTAQEYVAFAGGGYSIIVDGVISNDTTWAGGKVYEIQRGVRVEKGATLTIEEGAIVKLPLYDAWRCDDLRVYGKLVVNGTYANPVVFTSIRDDSWGGDTNGDGSRSEPYPGEAHGVNIDGGGIEARYAKFLYGNATGGHGAHACLMSYNKEYSTLYGCEFSHSAMDGCFISGSRLENCIFTDCDRGLVSCSSSGPGCPVAINCVAYGNRIGFCSHDINIYVTNSIAAFNSEFGIGNAGAVVHSTRCCLYNPGGQNDVLARDVWFGQAVAHGKDNIEADPLFLDPENGDFRISVESPCVDSAYGEVAPMNDFYEQPRMDVKYVRNTGSPNAAGEYPDIGIYEVPGTTERPVMNLEVENVAIVANGASSQLPIAIAPGETFTVSYTVRNTGNTAAKGSIRDVVRIKSAANGGTMTAGTVAQLYNLEAGGSAALVAAVTMPAAPAGEWLVGIDVNPNRDVFEQNFLKNSMWTEDAVEVTLQEMTAGSVWSANVPAGTTMGYVLAGLPEEGGVVVITESGGHGVTALPVVARIAAGHMPTAVMNDATSFVRADGALVVVVPAHAAGDQVYLTLENTGISAETVNVSVQVLTTELWSVYPLSAANVGEMGFTFTGAGLKADSGYYLGNIPAKSVTVLDSANVFAVFDVQNIPADRYYDIKAAGITMREVIRIDKVAKGPILEAKLELPERTRDNRVYTGYVVYENKGDTQMNAPMFVVSREEIRNAGYTETDTRTLLGQYDANVLTSNAVLIAGIGSTHPAGILKPGDSGRLPFKFKPLQRYYIKLDKWATTRSDVADMATRLNLRGRINWNGDDIYYSALNVRNGNPVAGVSGWLLDSRTHEPLEGIALTLMTTNAVSTNAVASVDAATNLTTRAYSTTTDASGYFQFQHMPDGAYSFMAQAGARVVSTNVVVEVSGQKDVNGVEVLALPAGRIHGYVVGSDGEPVRYAAVVLNSDGMMTGEETETDGYGAYAFNGVSDGTYEVEVKEFGCYAAASVEDVTVNATNLEQRVDIEMAFRASVSGTVTYNGEPVADGTVSAMSLATGERTSVSVGTNGIYVICGIAPGDCVLSYSAVERDSEPVEFTVAAGENECNIASRWAPRFDSVSGRAYVEKGASWTATFMVTAPTTNDVSYTWDFGDGSGTLTTTNTLVQHTYTRPNSANEVDYFNVTFTAMQADGTADGPWTMENCICLMDPLETIYHDNAIVLSEADRHNAGTLQFIDFDPDDAEEGTVMRVKGRPDIDLVGAVVLVGYDSGDDLVSGVRRVLSCTTDEATGVITCQTEPGRLSEIFLQIGESASQTVTPVSDEEAEAAAAAHLTSSPRLQSAGSAIINAVGKAGELGKKTAAFLNRGGLLIGDVGLGVGCEVAEDCLKGTIDTEITKTVHERTIRRKYVGKMADMGWQEPRNVTYTNKTWRYTMTLHVDFTPYVQMNCSIGKGYEKRTDKCELDILAKLKELGLTNREYFSVRVHGIPVAKVKPVLQFRPSVGGYVNGAARLNARIHGDLVFDCWVEDSIFELPSVETDRSHLQIDKSVTAVSEEFSASVEGSLGVVVAAKTTIAGFVNCLAGVEAGAQFKAVKSLDEPLMFEIGAAINFLAEVDLFDHVFFESLLTRVSVLKFSGCLYNIFRYRWYAPKADFIWDQTSGSEKDGYWVRFQDFSKPAYTAWQDRGMGDGIAKAINMATWLVGSSSRASRRSWTIEETPMQHVKWVYGDEEGILGGALIPWTYVDPEYSKNHSHQYPGPGIYRVENAPYCNFVDWVAAGGSIIGGSCEKYITVKKMKEKEEEEVDDETKTEDKSIDQKITLTQVSCDPNEMAGPEGVGEERFVKPGQKMTYTIYFENKADAAIAAQEVYIENKLSKYLDWSTFEMETVSVGGQIDSGLDGVTATDLAALDFAASEIDQTNGLYKTRTEIAFDKDTGTVAWYIRVLDPKKRGTGNGERGTAGGECWPDDPDAGVLQPNILPPEGEGYIIYSVKVREDAPAKAIIDNSADIVFDANAAIVTDPAWWNTVAPAGAGFATDEVEANEGEKATIRVNGGSAETNSSVKVYLTYNTAAAADLDLGKTKYPVTLTWEKGEVGEKVVEIPVKADKTIEDDEFLTLQLADAQGMELGEARVCTVTIKDPGYAELAAKVVAGTATAAEMKAWTKLQAAKAPYIRGLADPANAGKVSGGGLCAAGKKVTLKASANKGFVFVGWQDSPIAIDGERLQPNAVAYTATTPSLVIDRTAKPAKSSATSTTLTNVTDSATFYACFITSAEDKAAITFGLNGVALAGAAAETPAPAWSNYCGVAVSWPVTSGGLSATTVKAAGLPAGLKLVQDKATKAYSVAGVPTAASKVDKKTGLTVSSKVKFTVTTGGKSTETFSIDLTIMPLPDWSVGTFDGQVGSRVPRDLESEEPVGTVSLAIAANGKISGKILESGKTWALSATSFSAVEGQLSDVDNLAFRAMVIGKAGKEVSTNEIVVVAKNGVGVLTGNFELQTSNFELASYQNLWKRADTKAAQPVFKKNVEYVLENGVKLTFKKDGVVAFAGKIGGASVSGTSQLINTGDAWKVTLYAPAKKGFDGWCATFAVELTLDEQSAVTAVAIGGE